VRKNSAVAGLAAPPSAPTRREMIIMSATLQPRKNASRQRLRTMRAADARDTPNATATATTRMTVITGRFGRSLVTATQAPSMAQAA
jgi:hypothetical protein